MIVKRYCPVHGKVLLEKWRTKCSSCGNKLYAKGKTAQVAARKLPKIFHGGHAYTIHD